MSLLQAKRPRLKHPGETVSFGVNLEPWLLGSETISSVSSVSAETGLTVASGAVNAATFDDDDYETCAIGCGVTYSCSGGTANNDYYVTITVVTSLSRTLVVVQLIQVRDR